MTLSLESWFPTFQMITVTSLFRAIQSLKIHNATSPVLATLHGLTTPEDEDDTVIPNM